MRRKDDPVYNPTPLGADPDDCRSCHLIDGGNQRDIANDLITKLNGGLPFSRICDNCLKLAIELKMEWLRAYARRRGELQAERHDQMFLAEERDMKMYYSDLAAAKARRNAPDKEREAP